MNFFFLLINCVTLYCSVSVILAPRCPWPVKALSLITLYIGGVMFLIYGLAIFGVTP